MIATRAPGVAPVTSSASPAHGVDQLEHARGEHEEPQQGDGPLAGQPWKGDGGDARGGR